MAPFTHRFRVRYHECDAQGHVFNAHYFAFFDVAMTELFRAVFPGGYAQMLEDHGIDMVVAEAHARFLGSARFDEEVELDVELTRIGTTATTTAFTLRRGNEVLVEGELRHVYVDTAGWEKTPIPAPMREALAAYARADAAAPAA
jgi:acyl-CoA thioester hydrolase